VDAVPLVLASRGGEEDGSVRQVGLPAQRRDARNGVVESCTSSSTRGSTPTRRATAGRTGIPGERPSLEDVAEAPRARRGTAAPRSTNGARSSRAFARNPITRCDQRRPRGEGRSRGSSALRSPPARAGQRRRRRRSPRAPRGRPRTVATILRCIPNQRTRWSSSGTTRGDPRTADAHPENPAVDALGE
jgi:hypothetical protein